MKKQIKGLIALGAAAAALGGGLIAMKVTEPSDKSSDSVTEEYTEPEGSDLVLVEDSSHAPGSHTAAEEHSHGFVKNVKVKNEHGEMEVVLANDAKDISEANYVMKGYEDIRMKDSVVRMLVSSADNLVSTGIIEENCTDFEKFGLGSTAASVEISYASGITKKLYIGTVAPVANATYVRVEGSDNVYTVANSSVSYYLEPVEDYIELIMLSEPPADAYPKVDSLRIERKDIPYDIYLEYGKYSEVSNSGGSSATHVMIEPVETFLEAGYAPDITAGMFGLTAEAVKSAHCTEKDIADAGLKAPFCTVTMKCSDGNEYVLLMSEPYMDEGVQKSSAMFKDANIIFTVTTEKAKWATVMPDDIASRLLFSSYVWNVTELTATDGERSETFSISMKDSSIKSNEAKQEDVVVKRNGETFDTERYRLFYTYLINLHAESLVLNGEKAEGKPFAAVTVKDGLLGTETKYEFYDYTVMKCIVSVNGEFKFFCSKANADGLIENIGKISTGETFTEIT